jgi:hypothetical protein
MGTQAMTKEPMPWWEAVSIYKANIQKAKATLDAVPAAKSAEPESSVPLGSGAELAHTQEPVAWAVMQPDSYSVFASRTLAEKMRELCAGGEIVPLYRQPPLTDAEREAIVWYAAFGTGDYAATLLGLLERLN